MSLLYYFGTATAATLIMALAVGTVFPKSRFYLRFVTAVLTMCAASSYGVVASIVLRYIGRKSLAQWTVARAFYLLLSPLGIRFEVEDEQHLLTRPAVFVSNHQSELDILALGALFPQHCSVTAKKQLKSMPFLGWFMSLSGTVFIDRANRDSAVATFAGAVKQMKAESQSVWIFPEGTRSNSIEPEMLPFKKGFLHLAMQAGVPVVPIVVQNYSRIYSWKLKNFNAGTIKVKCLPPIDTNDLTAADVDRVTRQTRERMLDELLKLHPTPVSKPKAADKQVLDDKSATTVS